MRKLKAELVTGMYAVVSLESRPFAGRSTGPLV